MAARPGLPRSLEHPLPAGLRDLLPDEARHLEQLAQLVQARFALYGYKLVTPPAFELADVIERGLGMLLPSDVLRFVEPESGEVCVLRPDMTPQIARIVATRLRDREPPYRLAYNGTVVRRRIGRAKKHRQIPQVGVELCGIAGPEADLEMLELAVDVLRKAGLSRFTVDISDAGIVRGLVTGLSSERADDITSALAKKDEARLADVASGCAYGDTLQKLARLRGGREALVLARALLAATPSASAAERLLSLFDAAHARGLGKFLTADATEVRGLAYYTGTIFSIYAPGPGEPIGGGGRYDGLLARFGEAMPAVGLGLDLDALAWARKEAGQVDNGRKGVVVVGPPDDMRLFALRSRGVSAVALPTREHAQNYAASWGFALVWDGSVLVDVASGVEVTISGSAAACDSTASSIDSIDEATEAVTSVLRTGARGA
ncbi:MAG: ATP phosphoribosyltransferase regulatory subunit [Polyangiaceae bacterium]|nr:ATP phosphoribosyltransferase regulatory subunit [Polyangiaceae bacterium]